MKRFVIHVSLLGCLLLFPATHAQDIPAVPSENETALSPVAAALSELKPISGSFNKNADYFIYLYSASWCGPCKRIMPQIVQLYKENLSKDKRIEIILLDLDATEEQAKKYVAHYNADFFATMGKNPAVDKLPGAYQVRGIPHCIAVDKNGNRIFGGHAAGLFHNLDKLK